MFAMRSKGHGFLSTFQKVVGLPYVKCVGIPVIYCLCSAAKATQCVMQ